MAKQNKKINPAKVLGILAIVAGAYYLVKNPAAASTTTSTAQA